MKKQLRLFLLFIILWGLVSTGAFAQNFGSEAELKEKATKLFDDDQFEEAYPLYAQLASIYNKDANINYRLGVCMLYAGEDKEKPIPFLELAAKSKDVEKEVFFYLAKAYHLNYRFDDAIKQYQNYQRLASKEKIEKLQVIHQIEMCRNGKRLLRNISDLIVIDKKEMSRADFYRSYDISAIGGKLLAKPDDATFKTPLDKKKKESSIIYFSSDNNQVYFASYGDDLSHGKDIYMVRKLPNGELSKPQTLGYPINTEYDEDYPFLHPNGKVLYFCSRGHNSMGGYDIFKSTLNESTNTWNKPVNMDFPINSPDDDILYITNADEKEAYFSSARGSATGKTAVYHINVERKPSDVVAIRGTFLKTGTDQDMNIKITVKDLESDVILGIYNTAPETGNFSMTLPSGSKLMYTVEATGFPTQSEVITIPAQHESSTLKQELSFEPATGKLNVKNEFNAEGSDEDYLTALSLIKEKSRMEVNVTEMAERASKEKVTESAASGERETSKPKKAANLSNEEIVKIAYEDAADVQKESKELNNQASLALVIANEKNEAAQTKAREVAQLSSTVNQTTEPVKRQAVNEQLSKANKELANLNQLTVTSYNVAKALELRADAKRKEADMSFQYAKDLEAAVKSKNSQQALAKLDEQQKKLEAITQKNDANAAILNSLKLDAENKKKELEKAQQTSADIKQEIADSETAIATTEADKSKEKNETIKQGMNDQIQGMKDDIVSGKKELAANELKVIQLQKEYDGINNQIEIFNNVADQVKTGNNDAVYATAAKIDKSKLEQQVNLLKNSDNSLASIKPLDSETKENKVLKLEEQAKSNASVTKENTAASDNKQLKTETEPETKTKTLASTAPANEKTDTPEETQAVIDKEDKQKGAVIAKTNPTETSKEEEITASITDSVMVAADKKYGNELVAVQAIPDNLQREQKKAGIYEAWANTIQQELAKKKNEVAAEKNDGKKKELAATVETLEKQLNDKQQEKAVSVAAIEKIKTEASTTAVVDNTAQNNNSDTLASTVVADKTEDNTNVNTVAEKTEPVLLATQKQIEQLEQLYQQELVSAENSSTESEKENKKIKAANNYINSLALVVNAKKSGLQKEQDTAKQEVLKQEIVALEKVIEPKQRQVAESSSKLASVSAVKEDNENAQLSQTITTAPVVKSSTIAKSKETMVYTNTVAKSNMEKAAGLTKEAEGIFVESNRVKEQASQQTDMNQKNELYIKAGELDKTAETKKIEAEQMIGTANTAEYRNNRHIISQYANSNLGKPEELAVADLKNDEAKIYFEKAQNFRKSAQLFETYYAKQNALQEAKENEQIALQKQNEALSVYKKNNPKLVVKQLSVAEVTAPPIEANQKPIESSATEVASNKEIKNTEPAVISTPQIIDDKEKVSEKAEPVKETIVKELPVVDTLKKEISPEIITKKEQSLETPLKEIAQQKQLTVDEERGITNLNETQPDEIKQPVTGTTEVVKPVESALNTAISDAKVNEKTAEKKNNFSAKELFERKYKSNYSSSHPIPLDEKLPDGLVFKVQIGAFKNPIPQDLFEGITPITGQTTQQGFVRYFAGLFLSCESAEKAKTIIHESGFKDAFIVAYNDGKRIPLPCNSDQVAAAVSKTVEEKNVPPVVIASTIPEKVQSPATKELVDKSEKRAELNAVTDVTTLSGLFYTIQVGVYSKPVEAQELKYIQPLYTEQINNHIRYHVGVYNDYSLAAEAKSIAINGGLRDAFIVTYYNGKRIAMSEASTLQAQGKPTIATAPHLNQLPVFGNQQNQSFNVAVNESKTVQTQKQSTTEIINPTTTLISSENTATVIKSSASPTEHGVVFKIQVGAFYDEVPLDVANKFLRIAKKGIKNYKDEKGLTIYTVGSYTTYEEADAVKKEIVSEGLTDAFVVAFADGKKISIEDARKAKGE